FSLLLRTLREQALLLNGPVSWGQVTGIKHQDLPQEVFRRAKIRLKLLAGFALERYRNLVRSKLWW
ncbi:hypothetical protein, partial [Chelativorans intermedius]|uniref:hypothetical protein n=1 Tax=Chelativorans intermedius TaxID=515947 RepID=UPI0021BF872F